MSPGGQPPCDAAGTVDLPAHKVVLAACCDYFRALLAGAGAAMRGGPSQGGAGGTPAAADGFDGGGGGEDGGDGGGSGSGPGVMVVSLPGVDGWALRLAVSALYERRVEVSADNLESLLAAASFLGAAALLEACATYMLGNLGLHTCLPLLLLAWRYNLGPLRDELMSYVCRRFSVLVRLGEASGGREVQGPAAAAATGSGIPAVAAGGFRMSDSGAGAGGAGACGGGLRTSDVGDGTQGGAGGHSPVRLCSLPLGLLLEVLRCEELAVEEESDVLQCCLDWLAGGADDAHVAADADGSGTEADPSGPAGIRAAAAAGELAASVHWASLPDPPNLRLTPGSAAQTRALALLLAAEEEQRQTVWRRQRPHSQQQQHIPGAVDDAGRAPEPLPAVARLRRVLADLQAAAAPAVSLCALPMALDDTTMGLATAAAGEWRQRASSSLPGTACSSSNHRSGVGRGLSDAAAPGRVGAVVRGGGGGGRPRRSLPTRLLAAGGHDGSWRAVKAVEVYDPRTDSWAAGPPLLQGLAFAAGAVAPWSSGASSPGLGGSGSGGSGWVYVVGGTPLCSSVWRLRWGADGPAGRAWEAGLPLLMPRAHAGVVAVAGSLAVVGGRSQVQQVQHVLSSMELLDPDAPCGPDVAPPLSAAAAIGAAAGAATLAPPATVWRRGPDMVLPRSAHACVVAGGRVYALGGAGAGGGGGGGALRATSGGGSGGGGTHRSGEVLDLGSGRWQLLGCDMATERKYLAAAAHGGRIFVCGGVSDCRSRLSSLEALDPREGRWRSLQPMTAPRSSHAMAALGGSLYVAGGQCSNADVAAIGSSASAAAAAGDRGAWAVGARAGSAGSSAGYGFGGLGSSPPYGSYGGILATPPVVQAVYGSAPSLGGGGVYGGSLACGGLGGWGLGPGLSGGAGGASIGGGGGGSSVSGSLGAGSAGGVEDGAVHQTVECYDTVGGRWRPCAPMRYGGRAGMALCAA